MAENRVVRNATIDDVDAIYKQICSLSEKSLDPVIFEHYYAKNLRSNDNIYLVAESAGSVIGFLSCHGQLLLHHTAPVYEIQELFVEPSYRSAGVGKQLMDALIARLSQREYDSLELTSSIKRVDAHRFYLRYGFAQSHLKFTMKGTTASLHQPYW